MARSSIIVAASDRTGLRRLGIPGNVAVLIFWICYCMQTMGKQHYRRR